MSPCFWFVLLFSLGYAQEVRTKQGVVVGKIDGNGTAIYLGIPFAKPPVGDLRWQIPQPVSSWSSPFNATKFGFSCMAVKSNAAFILPFNEDEDCLTINVWVPRAVYESKNKVPVMVFIHGGAFILGSSSHPMTSPDPEEFARNNSIVYVSFNYRLGPLGFLSHPGFEHLNFGLYDQIAALKWVQENIHEFSGDPSRVTISGSSAGAISICFLLTSPLADGLFHRVVFQSTLCDFDFDNREKALSRTSELSRAVGCKMEDLACLRSIPADLLHSAIPPSRGILWTKGARWFPIIEGTDASISPRHPLHTLQQYGANKDIDVIIGYVRDEGSMFVFLGFPLIVPGEYISGMMKKTFKDDYKKILDLYKLDLDNNAEPDNLGITSDFGTTTSRILSDIWECSSHRLATLLSDKIGSRVHLYKFLHLPSHLGWPLASFLGVSHGLELNYIYNSPRVVITDEDKIVAKRLSEIWGWFTKHSEPLPGEDSTTITWPEYRGEFPITFHMHAGKEYFVVERPPFCHVLDSLLSPEGLLLMPQPLEEPLYSWILNAFVISNRQLVAIGITAIVVGTFFLSVYCCNFRGRSSKRMTREKMD